MPETLVRHDEESPLESALALARWGCPVFPLKPGGKVPATGRGFKDGFPEPSRDPRVVDQESPLRSGSGHRPRAGRARR
jgi:hypothetical protein